MKAKFSLTKCLAPSVAIGLLLFSMAACTTTTDTSQSVTGASSAPTSGSSPTQSTKAATSANNSATPRKGSLENASPEEVGRIALATASRWETPGSTAQVVLARRTTLDEVSTMGLGCYNFASIETPPLMLVVLKGDFNVAGMMPDVTLPGARTDEHVTYIAYVFDLWAGQPSIIVTSPHGGKLRKVLNDPTWPNDLPGQTSPLQPPCPSGTAQPKTLHYGDVAPAAATPTWDSKIPRPAPSPTETPSLPTPTTLPQPVGTDTAP